MLIDTGGLVSFNSEPYYVSDKTINLIKSWGFAHIDYLILTHGDYDHMGDSINLINNLKIKKVIFNNNQYNDLELELIKKLNQNNISYYKNIEKLILKNNTLYFLNTKLYDNENDNSNVIYFKYNNYQFLFMGDAGITREKDLLEQYNLTNINVLKVGHHGSSTSSSEDFLKKINPQYSIISVGKNNRYGHPNKEVIKKLDNSKIYRTDIDGSIMFKINNNKLKIENYFP